MTMRLLVSLFFVGLVCSASGAAFPRFDGDGAPEHADSTEEQRVGSTKREDQLRLDHKLSANLAGNTNPNAPPAADGLTCWMCKKLLPYVGDHECAEKCKDWWSWTVEACTDVCDLLVKYLPAQYPCAAAGYCPW